MSSSRRYGDNSGGSGQPQRGSRHEYAHGGISMHPRGRDGREPREPLPGLKSLVDGHDIPRKNEAIYGFDIDQLQERPWLRQGADLTAWFNYGFNEETWKEYCMMQPTGQKALARQTQSGRRQRAQQPPPGPRNAPQPDLTAMFNQLAQGMRPPQGVGTSPQTDLLGGAFGNLGGGLGGLSGLLGGLQGMQGLQGLGGAGGPDIMSLLNPQEAQKRPHGGDDGGDRRRRRDE
eukprot:TRINITY_DN5620_c0_g1_i1.p1 TRINITY_DN5620_c0_g1~~TRINITY_DN5620_c0_g1_i1.p1  ORF type:complete len:261 (+),score=75.80 TRINITY_DN5620_c0_g1_i1:88-783(+)